MDPIIRSEGLTLRSWSAADKAVVRDIVMVSRADFRGFLPGLDAQLADFEAFLAYAERSATGGSAWYYCVEADGSVVGQCSIEKRSDNTAEVGY